MLAKTMLIALTTKRMNESVIMAQSNRARPIPVTAIGGMIATEIAIPGRVALSFGLISANDAAAPATTAIAMLMMDGSVRERIELLSSTPSSACELKISVAIAAIGIAHASDFTTVQKDLKISFESAMTTPRESPRIGESSGAISIDPMITATSSISSPSAAMSTARTVIKKKSSCGVLSSMSRLIESFLSLSVSVLKRVVGIDSFICPYDIIIGVC